MSQQIPADINPSATSGTQLANLLNLFKDAIASGFSGTSRPTLLQAGGYWIDTTNNPTTWAYKIYTGSLDITIFTINLVTGTVSLAGADGQFSLTKSSDDSVGPMLNFIKKRILGSGQTLTGDVLGEMAFNSTDDDGDQQISARIRVISADTTTDAELGAYITIELVDTDGTSLTEKMRFHDGKFGVGVSDVPSFDIHAKGSLGIGSENQSDSTTAAKFTGRKKRATGLGQVLSGDSLVQVSAKSTDEAGAVINDAFVMEAVATENHTTIAQGTKVDFKVKAETTTTLTTVFSVLAKGISSIVGLFIGTHATAATNVRVYRSGTGKISVALGDSSVAEGSEPTTLAQLAHIVERFTTGTKPANSVGNTGRIIYVTDTNKFEYDTGSAWAGLGGGALVVSTQNTLTAAAPIQITGTDSRRKIKIQSTSGEVDLGVLANQIQNGVSDGDEIKLQGLSSAAYVILRKGVGNVVLNGDWYSTASSMLVLTWDSTLSAWVEDYRNNI